MSSPLDGVPVRVHVDRDRAREQVAELRARLHATLVAQTCDLCGRGHGRHWTGCADYECVHGVIGQCAYCRGIVPADDGPDTDD